MAQIVNKSEAPYGTYTKVGDVADLLEAELTLQETGGTVTATGAEQTLYVNDAPVGCFEPRVLFVDLDNMGTGDAVTLRAYYRIIDGGGLQLLTYASYTGADGGLADGKKLVTMDLFPNRFGIQITLQQTAEVMRDFDWEVVEEGGP